MNQRTWFLWLARAEGLSLLSLWFGAMPWRAFTGDREPVAWLGWTHGVLFLVYVIALWSVARVEGWTWRGRLGAFVASLLPFGTFVMERRLGPPPQG